MFMFLKIYRDINRWH